MTKKTILVYIEGEGGGRTSRKRNYLDGEFRRAWRQFLQPLVDHAKNMSFRCIAGRGGGSTTDRFATPLPDQNGALRILLIDSEGPVKDASKPWNALQQKRPTWADDRNCFLMVQCLETWLLADVNSLRTHYNSHKKCFQDNQLKKWPNLEAVARKTLQGALEQATSRCTNPYGHADGNLLIAIVDRKQLMKLPSVTRLFRDFEAKIDEYAAA